MPVTLKDVAEKAGVSRSAVSRTFTERASVSAKTRRKVEKAAAELGYSPNALASSLTTGRTKLIGLVSNNFHNPFFLQVFDLFTRLLQERGLRPLLVNLTDQTGDVRNILIDLAQRETMNLSKKFANDLVREVGRETQLLRNTHRFAGFAVLKSPVVPSILFEIGYMGIDGCCFFHSYK